jgi:hypothetical protein
MEELPLGDARLLVPRLKPEDAYTVASTLRENRAKIAALPVADIADACDRAIGTWKDNARPEKQAALKYLPLLTDLSPEMIERFHFGAFSQFNRRTIEAYAAIQLDKKVLKSFIPLESLGTYLRGYTGFLGHVWLKMNVLKAENVQLATFIPPAGTTGYFESLGMLLGSIVRAATLVKTAPGQPLFAPMFARSVAAASPAIGETLAVLPWHGGDTAIEDAVFRQSNAVCIMGSQVTTKAVGDRINALNQRENLTIKGCYHGGKHGLGLIAREHATPDVAKLAAIDGIGYEGQLCFSPAFGHFVERGGPLSPEQFAGALAEEAGRLSKSIPQMPAHREARVKKLTEIQAAPADGRRVITTPGQDFAVVYEPAPSMKPTCMDRLFRVMPVDRLEDVIPLLKPWTASLQTAGIAVPDDRLLRLADRLGKEGVSSLRVTGTMTQPKLGEAWDGNLPGLEYYLPDAAKWVSINTINLDREIGQLTRAK